MEEGQKLKLAVFISGSGTNLQSLLDRSSDGRLLADVLLVISDRADAYGLERARRHGVPAYVVEYGKYFEKFSHVTDRIERRRLSYEEAETEIIGILKNYDIDYVVLAGFMRLLTPYFLEHFKTGEGVFRVLNIHPALLPSFPGRHGYEDTFRYGCRWGGVTVHFVDEGEDSGPIIAQAVYPIFPNDSLEDIRKRGLSLEYEIYAQCINWLAKGMVRISKDQNGKPKVIVVDPEYRNILLSWISFAFNQLRK